MDIRSAELADVEAIARVHLDAWVSAYRGVLENEYLASLNRDTFASYSRPRFDEFTGLPALAEPFLVARSDGAEGVIVGFARGGPTRRHSPTGDVLEVDLSCYSAELYAIYVDPTVQSRGIGRALFDRVVGELRSLGHTTLCVWVLTGNAHARRFYERLGATEIGESAITLGGRQYQQSAYGWRTL